MHPYENKIYSVFSVFMQILLDNIHLLTSSSSLFQHIWGCYNEFLRYTLYSIQVYNVLSSANKINLNKGMMKMRKTNEPKFDP